MNVEHGRLIYGKRVKDIHDRIKFHVNYNPETKKKSKRLTAVFTLNTYTSPQCMAMLPQR
jgi:hypothetical protein